MCEVSQHEPKYITTSMSSYLDLPAPDFSSAFLARFASAPASFDYSDASKDAPLAHGIRQGSIGAAGADDAQLGKAKLCKFFARGFCSHGELCHFSHGRQDVAPLAPPPGLGYEPAAFDFDDDALGDVPQGPPPGLPSALAFAAMGYDVGYDAGYDLGCDDGSDGMRKHGKHPNRGFGGTSSWQQQKFAKEHEQGWTRWSTDAAHLDPVACFGPQLAWACGFQHQAAAACGAAAGAPAPPGQWSRTSSTTAPTTASPPPSPSRSGTSSPTPAAAAAPPPGSSAIASPDLDLPVFFGEDLGPEQIVKEGLSRSVDTETDTVIVEWLVKESRLRSLDKQAVSPSFKISLPDQDSATFRIMITPAARSDSRGAGSFKQSKGRGRISVKCVEPPADMKHMTLTLSLRVGEGPTGEPQRGPFTHDFIDRSCFEQQDDTWNFGLACDSRRVFAIQLLLKGVRIEE